MSTYAVFGMTRSRAYQDAKRKVEPYDRDEKRPLSEAEWLDRVAQAVDRAMAGSGVVQLSDKYDAPHFAFLWLDMAKGDGARDLHVKARTPKLSNGVPARNPKTGREILEWQAVERP